MLGAFETAPKLRGLVKNANERTLELKSQVDVQVRALSFRNLRGATNIAVIADELAYWRSDESATPDKAVIDALKPSLATTHGPLIGFRRPMRAKGCFTGRSPGSTGRRGARGCSWPRATPKPSTHRSVTSSLEEQYADDPVAAASEYGCAWRDDIAAFIAAEVVEAAVVTGRFELPYNSALSYVAFTDTAGGSGADSFSLAIAHREKVAGSDVFKGVLDCVREIRPPFNPDAATQEMAAMLKSYGLKKVVGDAYGGSWPAERFKAHGITYDISTKVKLQSKVSNETPSGPLYRSEIYKTLLPLLNAGRVELLDHKKMVNQLPVWRGASGSPGTTASTILTAGTDLSTLLQVRSAGHGTPSVSPS